MSLLSRLESLFEALVEGSFRKAFAAPVQPLEIARALEREMLSQRAVGATSVDVPNTYVAQLNPADFERLSALRSTVERDAAAHLERRASEQDLRPIGMVRVQLASEPRVSRGAVRAVASFDEEATTMESPVDQTRRLEPLRAVRTKRLVLVDEDGRTTALNGDPLRIGRGADNDLVVPDLRVSRYHVVIEPAKDGWIVRDLRSTNGTFLDGERVNEARMDGASELSLGGYQMVLRAG